jgi:phage tail-like protein
MEKLDLVDPFRGYSFLVEFGQLVKLGFQECSGLDSQTASIDYREGRDPRQLRKVPGLNACSPITFKRGMTDSKDLWDWHRAAAKGVVDRRSGSIILRDEQFNPVKTYQFFRAWPCKWIGPAFNATSNAVAIETLEIMVEEIQMFGD